jgi:hypothetical protein
MGISLITALTIQNQGSNIHCEPYGQHKDTGKWAGAINLYHDGFFHTTLLSSEATFDSSELAVKAMEDVVQQVRKADLSV